MEEAKADLERSTTLTITTLELVTLVILIRCVNVSDLGTVRKLLGGAYCVELIG